MGALAKLPVQLDGRFKANTIWERDYNTILSRSGHLKASSSPKSISDGKQDKAALGMWKIDLLSKVRLSECRFQTNSQAVALLNVYTLSYFSVIWPLLPSFLNVFSA